MKKATIFSLLGLVFCLVITSCGQAGHLYLPETQPHAAQKME
jgi:predicted small lipoprotein YifL